MPAVTQRVDDSLGGVSRQSDDKKLPGQVEECINGYPDPTFGLTKRPGFQHIGNLGTGTTYDNSKWFFISRTETEKYIGCITPASGGATGAIAVWNAVTFAPATIVSGRIVGDDDQYTRLQQQEVQQRALAMEYETSQGQFTMFGHPQDSQNYYQSYQPFHALQR